MNALSFPYRDHVVRTALVAGVLWFVAKDVCGVMGLTWSGATLAAIPDAWKGVLKFNTPGGEQDLTVISEPALYKLAFRSNKREAEEFTNHVASEILPSIRKTGAYLVTTDTPQNKFAVMRQMLDQLEEQETRIQRNERDIARVSDRVDLLGADTGYRTIRAFAKERGLTLPERDAKALGVRVAAICRQRQIRIGDVPDEKYGSVHSYPVSIIEEAAAQTIIRP